MSAAPLAKARPRVRLPEPWILAAIAATWALAIAAELSGGRSLVHHHEVAGHPSVRGFVLFLGAWTAMIVAMMLPATLPFIRLFFRIAQPQVSPSAARSALLAGYGLVWLAFGVAALALDMGVHRLVDGWDALRLRPWLIPGTTLLAAGLFQFSDLKAKCLTECRHPAAYLMRHYRRGTRAAFATGLGHAQFCVGCCWALMLLMFGMGIANLAWMALLTAIMIFEKGLPGGDKLVRPLGAALVVLAVFVLIQPEWLPAALRYSPEAPGVTHRH